MPAALVSNTETVAQKWRDCFGIGLFRRGPPDLSWRMNPLESGRDRHCGRQGTPGRVLPPVNRMFVVMPKISLEKPAYVRDDQE